MGEMPSGGAGKISKRSGAGKRDAGGGKGELLEIKKSLLSLAKETVGAIKVGHRSQNCIMNGVITNSVPRVCWALHKNQAWGQDRSDRSFCARSCVGARARTGIASDEISCVKCLSPRRGSRNRWSS